MNCFSVTLPGFEAGMDVLLREKDYEFVEHHTRPCVLVIPGGGYSFLAAREGEPIAIGFLQAGYQVCILRYSVRAQEGEPFLDNLPLRQAAAAVRYIRTQAEAWGIDPKKIIVCGSSAGGHLAGSLGVFAHNAAYLPENTDGLSTPAAMILCYPVITAREKAHRDSIYNLCGTREICEESLRWSLEEHVTKDTCPAFLWQTAQDDCVPVENVMLMARALRGADVPFELHIYSHGPHGLSLATPEAGYDHPHVATWLPLALQWLNERGVGTGY